MKRNSKNSFFFYQFKNNFAHFEGLNTFLRSMWRKEEKNSTACAPCARGQTRRFFQSSTYKNIPDRQQYIRFQKSQKVLNHSTLLSTHASSTSRLTPTSCFEGLVQTEHSHKASQGEAIYVYGEKKTKRKKYIYI